MYCQSCGNQINEELSFCNRCGNRVVGRNELAVRDGGTASVLKSLSIATGFVGVTGLGGLIALIAILVASGIHSEVIAILSLMFAATAFGICFLLTRQISRLTDNTLSVNQISKQKPAPEQLNSIAAEQIEAPRAVFRSVTENTTRTLDKNKV